METLVNVLRKEIGRVKAIIKQYQEPTLNGAGDMAVALMEAEVEIAEEAILNNDNLQMDSSYKMLMMWESDAPVFITDVLGFGDENK